MGSVLIKDINDLGSVIGNAFTAPLKGVFGRSCEDVCSGQWDVVCFIEHFCISSIVKLLLILVICYITLLFMYLLFKLGICQCLGKSLCKMCWIAFETYWFSLEHSTCYLWHKLINTKRVYHGRHGFQDVELGYSSTDETSVSYDHIEVGRKRKRPRDRRKYHVRNSLYLSSRHGSVHTHHHRVRLRGRNEHGKSKKSRIFKRQRLK